MEKSGVMLHFEGEGYGFMSGVTEYVTFHTPRVTEEARIPAPHFKLTGEEEAVVPEWFPEDTALVAR